MYLSHNIYPNQRPYDRPAYRQISSRNARSHTLSILNHASIHNHKQELIQGGFVNNAVLSNASQHVPRREVGDVRIFASQTKEPALVCFEGWSR